MDVVAYFKSLTQELEALKNRVRNFIDDSHWLTDGEWKESVLRSVLASRLPNTVRIGRGFILSEEGVSSQCDIILYKADSPVFFREGDLVILSPNAVLGVLEVKTRLDNRNLRQSVKKLSSIGRHLGDRKLLGLFSYESGIGRDISILKTLQRECDDWTKVISVLCIGCSTFVKWWDCPPLDTEAARSDLHYQMWHSYCLENMAAGYFLTNVIYRVCPRELWWNDGLWFPETSKEVYRTGEIAFRDWPSR